MKMVVIGGGYGDEGKGVFTDYFTHESLLGGRDVHVVRFNGGAQAGHTVVTGDGRRHVFHHFGSGSFVGAPTHLSKFFVVNPASYVEELRSLKALGVFPIVSADPRCLVTTPFDVFVNQIVETVRSGNRHGSCGVGFGETIERSLHREFSLTVEDFRFEDVVLFALLKNIRDIWLPQRLSSLGVSVIPDEFSDLFRSDHVIERFIEDVRSFHADIFVVPDRDVVSNENVVFEGAQGLMLDQIHGAFPFVTRSNTGCKNVVDLLDEIGCKQFSTIHLHRAYTTRHGAGPLANETNGAIGFDVEDLTNLQNPWQGQLRFAPFDIDEFVRSIVFDRSFLSDDHVVDKFVGISCLDQATDVFSVVREGKIIKTNAVDLFDILKKALPDVSFYGSRGPSRSTVSEIS